MAGQEIYGMLAAITVELPYETEEEQKRADELNERIRGTGFRTLRAATDWGYMQYEGTATRLKNENPNRKHIPHVEPARFESGDLVKIFKTVSDGDVQWQGTVDLDISIHPIGFQKGLNETEWKIMFADELPARLEKDGRVMFGGLEIYSATGEGVHWAFHEYGQPGYAGLHFIEDGDKLTVYNYVRDGDVEWQGRLDFGPEKVGKIDWTEIMRETNHMNTRRWLQMTWENRPVVVMKGP